MNSLANDLQSGFSILWYEIESVLGRGGFGITYLARDNNLGQQVAIKEYLPLDFAMRCGDSTVQPVSVDQSEVFDWGLERFMREAQTLAKFKHSNIVRVSSVFKQNNTGYMVMDYEQGEDLSHVYKREKQLTQQALENIYYPIIHGLSSVHKDGFIHRDIKPANIYIRDDGSPVLIDFGAARQAVGTRAEALTSMLSIGYAPFEQYNEAPGKQGPWTDIYALGASMYQGVTGEKPVESSIRGMAMLHNECDPYEPLSVVPRPAGYSRSFLRAIDQALMIQVQDRPQTLGEFLAMLKGDIALPDLSDTSFKITESTMIREKTVIRPRNHKFSGVDAKRCGPVTRAEAIERTTAKPLFSLPGILIITVTVVASVLAFVLLPDLISPQNTKQQSIQTLFEKAENQIQAGLYYDKSGEGALNTYQQVLSIDSQNSAAIKGVDHVGLLILKQAQQSMDNKDLTSADEELRIIGRFMPKLNGLSEARKKFKHLLDTEKKLKQIEVILDMAGIALGKGQVYEPEQENAIFYYQNVIQLDQNNVTARLGLSDISDKLIIDAQNEIGRKHFTNAEKLLTLAETIKPESPSIKNLREKIQRATQLESLLTQANTAYKKKHYLMPENDNAYLFYKKVLSLEPSNSTAKSRLSEIRDFYADGARKNTQSGNITIAKKNLTILDKYFPGYSGLSDLKSGLTRNETRINNAKKAIQDLATANTFLPPGINQEQDDFLVVQDIVEQFMESFRSMDMRGLLKVSRLTDQQHSLYSNIFKSYKSLKITVIPKSFKLTKGYGTGSVKFYISDLVDVKGHPVSSTAGWTKIEIKIIRKNNNWLKVEIL